MSFPIYTKRPFPDRHYLLETVPLLVFAVYYLATFSANFLPTLNLTTFFAAILISFPV